MSILKWRNARATSLGLMGAVLLLLPFLSCSKSPEPIPGQSVLDGLSQPHRIELSFRPPGRPAWNVLLVKDPEWRVANPEGRADIQKIEHLLELLSSFKAEERVSNALPKDIGLLPYRFEIRIEEHRDGKNLSRLLRLGDWTSNHGVYFSTQETIWIGRGALAQYLGNITQPHFFEHRSLFLTPYERIQSVRILREFPSKLEWTFERNGTGWQETRKRLPPGASVWVEKILRQYREDWAEDSAAWTDANEKTAPLDWKIEIQSQGDGKDAGGETLEIRFPLDSIQGRNLAISPRIQKLYPEFAGALRALTQFGSTPRKSSIKK